MEDKVSKQETKRQEYERLRSRLSLERSSFISHWQDLGSYILPRRPRFLITDKNRGDRRTSSILDSTATTAARTLRSGMMGGVTSPARPWFKLTTDDEDLNDDYSVKTWLEIVTQRMTNVFLKSNLYNTLPIVYGDLGVFSTAAMFIEEDFDDVIRTTALPIGSYMIANDASGRVRVFFREFSMTVRQLIEKFANRDAKGEIDWSNFSDTVKQKWELDDFEAWIDVCHVIQPNTDYDDGKLDSKFKQFTSCYYERGTQAAGQGYPAEDRYLRESGFDYFPVLAPRWELTGEDSYGTDCPGMTALGDIKQLQLGERRILQAIEKMVNPPLVAPTALKTMKVTQLPGEISYSDEREGNKGLRPLHEVNPRVAEMENKQEQVRQRIRKAFFEDLFLMLANSDRREITAREIDERVEEKLLALGPVLEQLNQDLLDPLIDITFAVMVKQGHIPEPPEILHGMPLKVEYVSIMAQAQKLAGISGIERFQQFVGAHIAATQDITIMDKVNSDELVESYAEQLSVPSRIIRSEDDTQAIRENRAKQQQAQAAAAAAGEMAKAGKTLSETDMDKNSALKQLLATAKAGQLVNQ